MSTNPLTPLPSSQCVAIIDMLRGWALLGVVLMNYGDFVNIGLVLFSGFGFGITNTLPVVYYYLFALSIYIAQVYFSKWWLARYYFGPVEWIWRQLSYGHRLPIKRAPVIRMEEQR